MDERDCVSVSWSISITLYGLIKIVCKKKHVDVRSQGNDNGDLLPIFVISVNGFVDRQKNINEQLSNQALRFEYILEFDPDELCVEKTKGFSSNLPLKSISCALKHIEAERRFVKKTDENEGRQFALILEDDCILDVGFSSKLPEILRELEEKPPGLLAFLGGLDNKMQRDWLYPSPEKLVKGSLTTAEAYIVDRESCIRRLAWLDENIAALPADHLLTEIDTALGIDHYRARTPLAYQGSITGKFRTSLDKSRAKHSAFFLWCRFKFNVMRRQTLPRMYFRVRHFFGMH